MPSDDPYGRFLNEFLEPVRDASEAPIDTSSHQSLEIGQFMEQFAGASFREGLYRVHSATTLAQVVEGFTFGFPAYAEQVLLFGYDWLGRQFGFPTSDPSGSQPRVILFEPGVGKAFDITANCSRSTTTFSSIRRMRRSPPPCSLIGRWRTLRPFRLG